MAPKPSGIKGFSLDWDPAIRNDITAGEWEDGVLTTLGYLMIPPCQSSQALLDGIARKGKTNRFTPERRPLMPDKSDAQAEADPEDPLTATIVGGAPDPPQDPPARGTGGGSASVLKFVGQDWSPPSDQVSLRAVDETLLHELVHTYRQNAGLEDSVPVEAPFEVLRRGDGSVIQLKTHTTATPQGIHSQVYNNYEEFAAILITNIYRSENKRPGLRRDHLEEAWLAYPLTNARNFLTVWRPQMGRLCDEMNELCSQLAEVECDFNPVFEWYAAQNRFLPGRRRVS